MIKPKKAITVKEVLNQAEESYAAGLVAGEKRLDVALRRWLTNQAPLKTVRIEDVRDWLTNRVKRGKK